MDVQSIVAVFLYIATLLVMVKISMAFVKLFKQAFCTFSLGFGEQLDFTIAESISDDCSDEDDATNDSSTEEVVFIPEKH